MFIRVKTTPNSPRKSVQLVESVRDGKKVKQKIVRHVGIAENDFELEKLQELAEFIKCGLEEKRTPKLIKPEELAKLVIKAKKEKRLRQIEGKEQMVNIKNLHEEQRTIVGIHEVYGKAYEEIGFEHVLKNPARNKSSNEILKDIVLARVANPKSKRGSVIMLEEDFGIEYNLENVYKMMDKLDDGVIAKIKETAYENTKKLLGEKIDVIFFDATTLYFESEKEDELRVQGYSKDGKFKDSQVLLALMVTKEGLPIGYEAFPGNTWEGNTLIPMLEELRKKYDIDKVVFVADGGLFCRDNLEALEKKGFSYIVGARLKNLTKDLQDEVLDKDSYKITARKDNEKNKKKDVPIKAKRIHYGAGANGVERTLITTHSVKRAGKDMAEREKNINKLIKKVEKNGKIQDLLSNYGYKKYVKADIKDRIEIDEEKVEKDARWDGLHGVITNDKNLSNEEVMEYYHGLWQVEESFRISKHVLKARPIFHWKPSRVSAHIAIAFMSFVCVRNLEYRVKLQYKKLSPEIIRKELLHVQGSLLVDKETKKKYFLPSKVGEHARKIYRLMGVKHETSCFALQ